MRQTAENITMAGAELRDSYRATELKIAVPPNEKQRELLGDVLALAGVWYGGLPAKSDNRVYWRTLDTLGLTYPRNGDVGNAVSRRLGDITLVGGDVLAESERPGGFVTLAAFDRPETTVRLVLAAPTGGGMSPRDVREVTTSYPRMTAEFFETQELPVPVIWSVRGGTEQYSALGDGVIADITETGGTLRGHGLEEIAGMAEVWPYLVVGDAFAEANPEMVGRLLDAAQSMGATMLGANPMRKDGAYS